jgi:hypothetical protein
MEGIQEGVFSGGAILRNFSSNFLRTSSSDSKLIAIVAPGGATANITSKRSFSPLLTRATE